jgi:hypothetical protein
MDWQGVPLKRLAELYGVVTTPEEARKFYRRQARINIRLIWGTNLFFLLLFATLVFTGVLA